MIAWEFVPNNGYLTRRLANSLGHSRGSSGDLVQFGGSTRLYLVQTHNVALKAQSDALAEAPKPGLSAADAIRMQKQRITAATQGAVASGQARQPAAAGEAAAKSAAPRMAKSVGEDRGGGKGRDGLRERGRFSVSC